MFVFTAEVVLGRVDISVKQTCLWASVLSVVWDHWDLLWFELFSNEYQDLLFAFFSLNFSNTQCSFPEALSMIHSCLDIFGLKMSVLEWKIQKQSHTSIVI